MNIVFIADGRSPTALNWVSYFIDAGHEVHLISSFPAQPGLDFASLHIVHLAFSDRTGSVAGTASWSARVIKTITSASLRTRMRQIAGGWTLRRGANQIQEIVNRIQPDLVHALRIPFEGMAASQAELNVPLAISIWGNDFTLHAPSSRRMGHLTRAAMKDADALLADCQRDLRLAGEWGYSAEKPQALFPGGGGIRSDMFYPPDDVVQEPLVINPRGLRAYVRNDTFFKAIPMVLRQIPSARFVCPAMAGESEAEEHIAHLDIGHAVSLLPHQTQAQMAALYRQARVAVSPSEHDGTPNTLLEAMACGCLPVAGDIEPVREWIHPPDNGLLVDPGDADALAGALIEALRSNLLANRARTHNLDLIQQRANRGVVMPRAEAFYEVLVTNHV